MALSVEEIREFAEEKDCILLVPHGTDVAKALNIESRFGSIRDWMRGLEVHYMPKLFTDKDWYFVQREACFCVNCSIKRVHRWPRLTV